MNRRTLLKFILSIATTLAIPTVAAPKEDEFYLYLADQFDDLESAKKWMNYWANDLEQETPYGLFSFRAMARHVSNVLEGVPNPTVAEWWASSYLDTKYGTELYFSAC